MTSPEPCVDLACRSRLASARSLSGPKLTEPPGGVLVWLIVGLEMVTFGIGLAVFLRMKVAEPMVFRAGREGLHWEFALVNTLFLITGGWVMANAQHRLREGDPRGAGRYMVFAIAFGMAFLVGKGIEYAAKINQGMGLHHDSFHTIYWLLTGFHYVHVIVAVVLLAAMAWGLGRPGGAGARLENVESSAVFWHMCDLIWLFLMPIIYLLP